MKKLIRLLMLVLLIFGSCILLLNQHVKSTSNNQMISIDEAILLDDIDCILVLGCEVKDDGQLSLMLRDRMDYSLALYHQMNTKLLMSGDHGRVDYDEVNAMKNYAIAHFVPSSDVFMDHAGFSTYDSIYRAK